MNGGPTETNGVNDNGFSVPDTETHLKHTGRKLVTADQTPIVDENGETKKITPAEYFVQLRHSMHRKKTAGAEQDATDEKQTTEVEPDQIGKVMPNPLYEATF